MIYLARAYANRPDLESAIKALSGTNGFKNEEAGHTIEGTKKELKNLHLDDQTNIWGIRCVITDKENTTKSLLEKKSGKKLYK